MRVWISIYFQADIILLKNIVIHFKITTRNAMNPADAVWYTKLGFAPTAAKSAVACAQLGVSFIGIEMDQGYLEEAIVRTRAALAGPKGPALREYTEGS